MHGAHPYGVMPFGMVSTASTSERMSVVVVSASAVAALNSFKVGRSKSDFNVAVSYDSSAAKLASKTMDIVADVFFGFTILKQGYGTAAAQASTSITTTASKSGVTFLSVPFAIDIYMGTGSVAVNATFSVTGAAAVNFLASKAASSSLLVPISAEIMAQSFKAGQGSANTSANASCSFSGLKVSTGSAAVTASASFGVSWYKSGSSRPEVLASVTISLMGGNPSVVIPVSIAYITTTSRHARAITTASRFEYQLTTSSGGSIV